MKRIPVIILPLVLFCMNTAFAQNNKPTVSFTFDDPAADSSSNYNPESDGILNILNGYGLKAALFVCGKRVDSPAGRELIRNWDNAGHMICNHSYSHSYYHSDKITAADFENDMLRCDSIINKYENYTKLFRYPYLKEGNTIEKRDGFRKYLSESGYRNGSVTIDASDWYIDQRIRDTLKADPDADITPFKEFYLQHIYERAVFYEKLAYELTGRHILHTLLLHYNMLNRLFLKNLIEMFREKGWNIVDAKIAFEDPVFSEVPEVLPAGESLVWAIAKRSGKYDDVLRYPGEDSQYEEEKLNDYLIDKKK